MNQCFDSDGWGPWSTSRSFDITVCFETLVLESIGKLFLLVCGIILLYRIQFKSQFQVSMNAFYFIKLGFCGLLSLLSIVAIATGLTIPTGSIVSNIFTFGLAGVLHHFEHYYSRVSTSYLLIFWLYCIVVTSIELRTAILIPMHMNIYFYATQLLLCIVVFSFECVPKPLSLYQTLDQPENVTPEETCNIFSRLTFHWMTSLMKLGHSKVLDMNDLWNLRPQDSTEVNSKIFNHHLENELSKENPSLVKVLFRTYWKTLLLSFIFKFFQDILQFTQPQLLHLMMLFVSTYAPDWGKEPSHIMNGFGIAFAMMITAICQTMFLHQYFHGCFMMGMRIRSSIIQQVYKKSLRLSNSARQGSTIGEITNLMAVDASKLADLCNYFHILWSGPMQIGIAVFCLYQTLGVAVFGGIAIMILMIPVNGWIAKKSRDLNRVQMGNKDERTKFMDEILSGMKVIKLYAWENPFIERILGIRDKELSTLKKIAFLQSLSSFTWSCTPFLVSFTTFGIYSLISPEPLTSTKVFVSLSLFNLLGFPLSAFPNVIASVVESSVSISRLLKFFMNEEKDNDAVLYYETFGSADVETRVVIENGTFCWGKGCQAILKDISFSLRDKQLTAVVGPVGCGKSTLISAILGDTYKSNGIVKVCGSIAFVPQQAWIMNATVQENILFGQPFDKSFYEQVLEACGLVQDLQCLIGGDQCQIGERGINLSGGQKQRVAIARAVYSCADIYIFDDALSAVDAHVGRHIFDYILGKQGILKNKTRLLVTHSIQYLANVDSVLMMNQGVIAESGSYQSLMERRGLLFLLVKEYGKKKNNSSDTINRDPCAEAIHHKAKLTAEENVDVSNVKTKIISNEDSAQGRVEWSVYTAYAVCCGFTSVVTFIGLTILGQCFSVFQNVVLSWWAQENDRSAHSFDRSTVIWYLSIYGSLGITYSIIIVFQVLYAWVFCGIRSARILHTKLLQSVMRLPQSFFDTTPLGRIMNRFSKDQYTIDEVIPRSFLGYFRTLFIVISVLAVNAVGNPYYVLLAFPLGSIYYYCQFFYLSTSRELKRLDSTSRSPIYSNFQETLNGVSSIRAFKQERRFIELNAHLVDFNQRAYYPSVSSNRWLAVRLEFIGSLIVFGSALFGSLAIFYDRSISSSIIGLMLVYALSVTQTLNWMVRQSCEIETNIVSVERIKEYSEIEQEAPAIIDSNRPMDNWPQEGNIVFQNYSTRYRTDLDLVLRNISFKVNPKEKLAIVGRSGAGKSSLTLALFRILEPAHGFITIDGVDIAKIGLFDLRSRISIIPQDPVLFHGTVRQNLDPFNTLLDSDLWNALEKVNLKSYIASFELGLEHIVLANGENFSVGQKQLICLARALVRNSKVLVLDESTASIDVETDAMIQKTIRKDMVDSTIITIAHRINTIIDSDRILVIDKGSIAEFDSPANLLNNKQGIFYSLAKEAGQVRQSK